MVTSFQECIVIWLKFYKGKILLHLIDHATRLSVSSFVKSKEPEVILKAIFKPWIQIYAAPEKVLTDNSREFANSKFIDMVESMIITVKVTAAESPCSNGLVERLWLHHSWHDGQSIIRGITTSRHGFNTGMVPSKLISKLAWFFTILTLIWMKPQTTSYFYQQTTSAYSTWY